MTIFHYIDISAIKWVLFNLYRHAIPQWNGNFKLYNFVLCDIFDIMTHFWYNDNFLVLVFLFLVFWFIWFSDYAQGSELSVLVYKKPSKLSRLQKFLIFRKILRPKFLKGFLMLCNKTSNTDVFRTFFRVKFLMGFLFFKKIQLSFL